MQISSYPI
ncbi:hypothetical protein CGCVW01_v000329 [Colletotrichum viniferum]|nr:hypothetical protein CGCVW01_v000329 [Colletotrichum viniferum]